MKYINFVETLDWDSYNEFLEWARLVYILQNL